jgi:hypothetical protein
MCEEGQEKREKQREGKQKKGREGYRIKYYSEEGQR